MKLAILSLMALLAIFLSACGTGMLIERKELIIDPPPSDVHTVGTLSGSSYSTAKDGLYKTQHSVGAGLGYQLRKSDNGKYSIK